ncbi:MAG: DUF1214 domain-containing protein [Clostridiales bacterium]|nr:DUF1214 domain-containing protein [Clostridiales bacterium]
MTNKAYRFLIVISGVICGYVLIKSIFFIQTRQIRTDVIQAMLVGFGLALATAFLIAEVRSKTVNGWKTTSGCGVSGGGMLLRAACTLAYPGPINSPREAMYWTASKDSANHGLSGERNYVLRFPAGELPPNDAFWSLTMGDAKNRFVENSINRYSVSDRSGLVPNADGSVSIYIQYAAPAGLESNWLPSPEGSFILWLRVYLPGESILAGEYNVPPVVEAA